MITGPTSLSVPFFWIRVQTWFLMEWANARSLRLQRHWMPDWISRTLPISMEQSARSRIWTVCMMQRFWNRMKRWKKISSCTPKAFTDSTATQIHFPESGWLSPIRIICMWYRTLRQNRWPSRRWMMSTHFLTCGPTIHLMRRQVEFRQSGRSNSVWSATGDVLEAAVFVHWHSIREGSFRHEVRNHWSLKQRHFRRIRNSKDIFMM